jgi:hypothetical protein
LRELGKLIDSYGFSLCYPVSDGAQRRIIGHVFSRAANSDGTLGEPDVQMDFDAAVGEPPRHDVHLFNKGRISSTRHAAVRGSAWESARF